MKNPRRRTSYETELVKLIREAGYYAIRVPASGRHDLDAIGDVSMCFNKIFIAIEVKSTNQDFLYCSKIRPDAEKLVSLSRKFIFPAVFAIRFINRSEGGWRFILPEDIIKHKKILRHKTFSKPEELSEHLKQVLQQ